MHRLVRSTAVAAVTMGLFTASAGSALAHDCYKVDKTANKAAENSDAWLSKSEAMAEIQGLQADAGEKCADEFAAVYAFLGDQPDTWRLMMPGLLAGGTEGTHRTPDHFGYSSSAIGPLFGCLFRGGE